MKFLEFAKRKGILNEDAIKHILRKQRLLRRTGQDQKVGQIAVADRLMLPSTRDDLISKHGISPMAEQVRENAPRFRTVQLTTVICAVLVFVLGIRRLHWHPGDTASLISFFTYVAMVCLEYFEDRRVMASLYRAAKPLFVLVAILCSIYAGWNLAGILWNMQIIVLALIGCVTLLLIYSIWKAHSLRSAESRTNALKDTVIRVHDILDNSETSLRQRFAIQVLLDGLRNVVELGAWDKVFRMFGPGTCVTSVLYFESNPEKQRFFIKFAAYPKDAPEEVTRAFDWIRDNHFPVMFCESRFEELVQIHKGANAKGWHDRFMNCLQRFDCISICGWIHAHGVALMSRDASNCRAFDARFIGALRTLGYSQKHLRWVDVGSFIGCPVPGPDNTPVGVLLVVKNLPNALNPEDHDAVVIASRILGQILRITTGEK